MRHALEYAKICDERMQLTKQEVELKTKLLRLMKEDSKEVYAYDGVEVRIVHEEETVKVKIRLSTDENVDG